MNVLHQIVQVLKPHISVAL